mmetsp:Transcript_89638/g.287441  ORF Transcript_89638/g.287441 Transcript_89638/m.287441 type:complete len:460 (-) Transcript_89638:13-1392(-)
MAAVEALAEAAGLVARFELAAAGLEKSLRRPLEAPTSPGSLQPWAKKDPVETWTVRCQTLCEGLDKATRDLAEAGRRRAEWSDQMQRRLNEHRERLAAAARAHGEAIGAGRRSLEWSTSAMDVERKPRIAGSAADTLQPESSAVVVTAVVEVRPSSAWHRASEVECLPAPSSPLAPRRVPSWQVQPQVEGPRVLSSPSAQQRIVLQSSSDCHSPLLLQPPQSRVQPLPRVCGSQMPPRVVSPSPSRVRSQSPSQAHQWQASPQMQPRALPQSPSRLRSQSPALKQLTPRRVRVLSPAAACPASPSVPSAQSRWSVTGATGMAAEGAPADFSAVSGICSPSQPSTTSRQSLSPATPSLGLSAARPTRLQWVAASPAAGVAADSRAVVATAVGTGQGGLASTSAGLATVAAAAAVAGAMDLSATPYAPRAAPWMASTLLSLSSGEGTHMHAPPMFGRSSLP